MRATIRPALCAILLSLLLLLSACSAGTAAAPVQTAAPAENTAAASGEAAGEVQLFFVNVGKADAMIIAAGASHYLVDTGTKESVPALLGALNYLGADGLEGVFLTHSHSDHVGGLELVAQALPIGQLYHADITELTDKGVNKFERFSEELSIPHTELSAGQTLTLDGGIELEVLGPLVPNTDDDNDQSLVLMLRVSGRKILLTGDMQFAEEQTLLSSGADLSADILKVGNHGNPDATSEDFAAAVSPALAVISTDTDEDADSANARVRRAFSGAEIYVTEDCGMGVLVTVSPDGSVEVSDTNMPAAEGPEISHIDKQTQTVTITNDGPGLDISGFMIFSSKGKELFVFPEGSYLAEGGTVTVACTPNSGDFVWPEEAVWHEEKNDTGILYDRYGAELGQYTAS